MAGLTAGNAARFSSIHRDVVAREILTEGFGQADHGGLGRRVGRHFRFALLAHNQRNIDDAALIVQTGR